jgi:xylulokinase
VRPAMTDNRAGGPADEACILAVDLGTSGCKTAVATASGRILAWESEAIPLHVLPAGGVEQDPADWWRAFTETARRAIAASGVPADRIVAVCCSAQGEATLPVDERGNPLMRAILWMDMRGAPHLRQITRGPVNVSGYHPLRLLRWVRLTGGAPSLSGKDPAAHMLLVRDAFPDVYRATYKFLNVPDYLNLRLTGRFAATPDSILTSWVTDNRDSANVRYHPGLVRGSGIDGNKLPDIVACTDVIGALLPEVADELGLPAGVRVVAGSIDTTSAAIGSGAVGDFEAHLYLGTSSWIAAHVPRKKTDVGSSIASVPCAIPGRYLMTVLQTTAGGNLSFLRDQVLYHQDELLAEAQVPDVFKVMDGIAERVPPGANGVLYLPWLYGERAPVEDGTLRAALFNISMENSREDIIRAFLEGVALNTRWMLGPAERFLGRPIHTLNAVGGGAGSDVWCQILADVLGVTVRQVRDPIQVNARGAALIAAVGLGLASFADVGRETEFRAEYRPRQEHRRLYDGMFRTFVDLYRANQPIYRRLNGNRGRTTPEATDA